MRSRKGFTLVELIVIIAILAIVGTIAGLSLSSISSAQTRKAVGEIDALLSACKISSMSRTGSSVLKLYRDGDGRVRCDLLCDGAAEDSADLPSRITVEYFTDADPGAAIDVSRPLCLSFVRDTGAFMPLSEVDGNTATGSCTSIRISSGASTGCVTLVPSTGSHSAGG